MPFEVSLPEIPGDPAGMRVLASALQSDARAIEGVASGIGSAVGSMTFEGPAANAFQQRTQSEGKQLGDLAGRLNETARLLQTSAAEVERLQAERLAKLEQMRRELASEGIPARVTP
jgi:uncharacterized protein YukE